MAPGGSSSKAPLPIGLQIRTHCVSGTDYWAAVAVEVMPSSAVTIVREYDGKYDTRASGSLAVGFLDEMEALGATRGSAGSGLGQRVLQGHVAWVTREWLESCFRSPSWEEFSASPCRTVGVTVGIMSGLLPRDGVPVHVEGGRRTAAAGTTSTKGGAGAHSSTSRKRRGGGGGGSGGQGDGRGQGAQGGLRGEGGGNAVGASGGLGGRLRGVLPVLLLNVGLGLLIWAVSRYMEAQRKGA